MLIDPGQIQQVLTNILVNAIQSMPRGGKATVAVGRRKVRSAVAPDAGERDCVFLSMADEGEGISPENLEQIFEPFFTTKEVGEGTGLGLSIAYGMVREHNGWIDVNSTLGKGSCFTVYLPQESNACAETS